jgi:hypothetical protein
LKESLHQCAHAAVTHLDAAFARISTLSPKQDILELEASAGLDTYLDGAHARIPVGPFKRGRIAPHRRRSHQTNDLVADPAVSDREWARREDTLNAPPWWAATVVIAIEQKRSGDSLAIQAAELKRSNEDLEQFAHVDPP